MKGRMCANGSTQTSFISKEEDSSPTVTTESVEVTSVVDAKQERDVVSMDISNAFVQTEVPQGDERILVKIQGALVDMLLNIDPEKHKDFVIGEGQNKFLCLHIIKALCGMLMASFFLLQQIQERH